METYTNFSSFIKSHTRQKWMLLAYLGLITLFFFLRFARNNAEFLFFSGVLEGFFLIYNNEIFEHRLLRKVYFIICSITALLAFSIKREFLGMSFSLVAFLIYMGYRHLFISIYHRSPKVDPLLQNNCDKLFSIALFISILAVWLAELIWLMDRYVV